MKKPGFGRVFFVYRNQHGPCLPACCFNIVPHPSH